MKEAMDTNLVEVADSSETVCMCDHVNSIGTNIPSFSAYCKLNFTQE